jgi:hypothetical protein
VPNRGSKVFRIKNQGFPDTFLFAGHYRKDMGKGASQMIKPARIFLYAIAPVFIIGGCMSLDGGPRTRAGAYPTATIGTPFIDCSDLGKHHYSYSYWDNGGIAYTCRGGHIDVDHVKIAADNTKYLSEKAYSHLMKGDREFTFGLNVDPSKYYVRLEYPAGWENLPKNQKQQISKEVSVELGAYLTYTMVSWHEILTWYGFHTLGFLPEFPSAFSWEDSYSNLIGTRLGVEALKNESRSYDDSMTALIKLELEYLGVQPKEISRYASEKMRGKWYTGYLLPDVKERNFDYGIENGFVTPTLVPGICPDAKPQSYPAPALSSLYKFGFTMNLEVDPRIWEQGRIYKAVHRDANSGRIKIPSDLKMISDDMKQEARKLGYHYLPEDHWITAP